MHEASAPGESSAVSVYSPMGLPPQPEQLETGGVRLLFDRVNGSLRRFSVGGREAFRQVYGAVRDQNWGTIPPRIHDLTIERGAGTFAARFTAECRAGDIHYVWRGEVRGVNGEVTFGFDGEAQSDFLSNRIGLCVLHPIHECAGRECEVEHNTGTIDRAQFPSRISPHQPFFDLRAVRHPVAEGLIAEARFEGDVFEMEDQRNWTDASFKIYAPPLARPFPVKVRKGDRVKQRVTLKTLGAIPAQGEQHGRQALRVQACWDRPLKKPGIGFGMAPDAVPSGRAIAWLKALRPDHLRVDLYLWRPDWQSRLEKADQLAGSLGAGLHLAVFLSEREDEQLRMVRAATRSLRAPAKTWLIFHKGESATSARWVRLAREVLGRETFAAGTDQNFAELNRTRPSPEADWMCCFPVNPQVHAADAMTMMENIAAQPEAIRTLRSFSHQPIAVSPITLLPRVGSDSVPVDREPPASPADPRQSSLFTAAWTLGSLAALGGAGAVRSLTYFETGGPRGLIPARGAGVYPVWQVFAGWAELEMQCQVELGPEARDRIAAVAGKRANGRGVLWVANLTREPVRVLLVDLGPKTVLKKMDESNLRDCAQEPDRWRDDDTAMELREGSLEIGPYGLARLETETNQ